MTAVQYDNDEHAATVDAYEEWLRSWASERTTAARVRLARNRLAAWHGLDGFTRDNIQRYLGRPELRSPWSKSTYHAHFRDFCAWAVAAGLLEEDPMGAVRRTKRPRSNPHPLSEVEAERVLSAASGDMRTWVLLALFAGLRAHEIAKIRGEDVTEHCIYVQGKGGVRAELPTHPEIWARAQDYPRYGYWFSGSDDGHLRAGTLSARVGMFFGGLNIEGGVHRCRHLYCTRLLRTGVNIRTVQRLMRHASLETTAAYAAVDENEMRDAIGRLSI
jgi:integrase